MKPGVAAVLPPLEAPREGMWLLAGFLVLSLFAHALAFYVFQIVYPPPVAIAPPPADVSLLDLSNPANDGLRRWIEAQDPSLLSRSRESVPQSLLTFPYRPSYAGIHSAPQAIAPEAPALVSPPVRDPAAVIRQAAAPGLASEQRAAPEESIVRFSGPLAGRRVEHETSLGPWAGAMPSPSASGLGAAAILEPARFLIAVTDGGEIRYAFLQSSSGDKAVDDQAEARLFQMRFAPDPAPLAWGVASFFWGNDAYRQ